MNGLFEVIAKDDIPVGKGRSFTVNGQEIALFNVNGAVFAIDDICLHQRSSLSSGRLEGKFVTCPRHGWRYDVTTGQVAHVRDYGVRCHPVKIIENRIWVEL